MIYLYNYSEEQQKVFEFTEKRKVILSTNIAESSITIPDIYYVIDFCLVKELRYNVKTSHESLELNWASKASCEQVFSIIKIRELVVQEE